MEQTKTSRNRDRDLPPKNTSTQYSVDDSETVKIIMKNDGQNPALIQIECNEADQAGLDSFSPRNVGGYQLPSTNRSYTTKNNLQDRANIRRAVGGVTKNNTLFNANHQAYNYPMLSPKQPTSNAVNYIRKSYAPG